MAFFFSNDVNLGTMWDLNTKHLCCNHCSLLQHSMGMLLNLSPYLLNMLYSCVCLVLNLDLASPPSTISSHRNLLWELTRDSSLSVRAGP